MTLYKRRDFCCVPPGLNFLIFLTLNNRVAGLLGAALGVKIADNFGSDAICLLFIPVVGRANGHLPLNKQSPHRVIANSTLQNFSVGLCDTAGIGVGALQGGIRGNGRFCWLRFMINSFSLCRFRLLFFLCLMMFTHIKHLVFLFILRYIFLKTVIFEQLIKVENAFLRLVHQKVFTYNYELMSGAILFYNGRIQLRWSYIIRMIIYFKFSPSIKGVPNPAH